MQTTKVGIICMKSQKAYILRKIRKQLVKKCCLLKILLLACKMYITSSSHYVSDLIEKSLGDKKCESIALILSCSGLSIQLCGKEEKVI